MQTYWDLSERERADLTEEQIEKYLQLELMGEGVLAPEPPEYEPEDAPDVEKEMLYTAEYTNGKYGHTVVDVRFRTLEQAQAFLALEPLGIDSFYASGKTITYTVPMENPKIGFDHMGVHASVERHKQALILASEVKARNTKLRDTYAKETKAATEATSRVRNDWWEMIARKRNHVRILDTMTKYVEMCDGDVEVAGRFLLQTSDVETIVEAFAWNDRDVPACVRVAANAAADKENDQEDAA